MKCVSSLLLSLVVHVALACVLILVPLVFCNALHPDELVTFLMAPPALPERPTPPAPPNMAMVNLKPIEITLCHDCAPQSIPNQIQYIQPPIETEDAWSSAMVSLPTTGVAAQNPAGRKGIEEILAQIKPYKLPDLKRPTPKEPVVVVSSMQESKLILKADPVYPKLAIATHASGTVIMEAIINEEGSVTNLTVISGHPLLVNAARDAVLRWKYSPTILDGEAVSVKTVIKITFRIR